MVFSGAEQNCFAHNFCIKNPNPLVLVAKFPKNHPLAAVENSENLEFVCCAVFVVFRRSYRFFLAFPLGFDICGDPESDPPQQIDQQQQGKQFDHFHHCPITLKLNISLYFYVCMLLCVKCR